MSRPANGAPERDEHGRLLPGSVRGWGASWWAAEQGLSLADVEAMSPAERVRLLDQYFEAESAGWEPSVRREDWVGGHHWSEPAPPPSQSETHTRSS
jgi:hypothetical protein